MKVQHKRINNQTRVGRVFVQRQTGHEARGKLLPNEPQSFFIETLNVPVRVTHKPFSSMLAKLAVDGAQLVWFVKIVRIDQERCTNHVGRCAV